MEKAEFGIILPNGDLISYDEILSPILVYRILGISEDRFILIPRENQKGFNNTIFLADENGVKECKDGDSMIEKKKVDASDIPQYVLTNVCFDLVKIIK